MSAPALDIGQALLDGLSDAEIVAALVADGMSKAGARDYLEAWRAGERPYVDQEPDIPSSGDWWENVQKP
jgi:hypothetical protein